MANHMETYVRITNGDINVAKKLKEIFTPDEGKYEVWTTELIKRIYDDVPNDDDDIDYAWCISNLGAKWMHSDFEYDDDCSCIHLMLTSAWSVPQQFLEQLAKVLHTIKEDCYISGNYEDEGFNPIGAYIYAKGYDDIEDLDVEVDFDKIWDDDEYRDDIYNQNHKLHDDMIGWYNDHLKDIEDNPEDYI